MSNREPRRQADGTYLLTLTQGKEAILCAVGAQVAAGYKWCYSHGYAVRFVGRAHTRLHREIAAVVGLDVSGDVDHVNTNKLDNQVANLRPATGSQNLCNRGAQRNNTSGYKGVSFHKDSGLFRADITVRRKRLALGRFATKEEAAEAYARAAAELHGEFHRLR